MPRKKDSDTNSQIARDYLERGCDLFEKNDYKQAYFYFHKAALLRDKEAQLNLGNLLYDGKGIKKNQRAALDWYKRSAKLGSFAAAFNLGIHYKNSKNGRWARYWFQKALELGDEDAQIELAKLGP